MLQLASAEAENMAALSFDDLLRSWGRGAIRRRFHELSMQVHPDKCSLPDADQARAFQPIRCCHSTLYGVCGPTASVWSSCMHEYHSRAPSI